MSVWEGRPRPWYQVLQVVVQTFTTTGFGEDAPWQSLQINLLVIAIQLAGIGFILSAVDVFVVPWLREALRPTAPKALSARSGHVIVCGYTPRVEIFITAISPETKLEDHVCLFVAGTADQLATLRNEVDAYVRAFTFQSILLAGYGDSGRAVAESLTNCTMLAISRESTFLTDPDDGGFTVEAGNEVVVAGTDDGIERFRERIAELGA
jgi:hypothetical protein